MVVSNDEMVNIASENHNAGVSVVTTCGCFDILHIGHKRLLEACSSIEPVSDLLVLVNSDRSVRVLKGEGRPNIPEAERAELISAFGCVDYVTIFDDDAPIELLRAIDPDIHCKGDDYKIEDVPERKYVRRVELIPITPDRSSTSIINSILCTNGHIDIDYLSQCPDVVVDKNHEWGIELRLVQTPLYTGKFLVYDNNVHAGSCHFHKNKTETFKIISGKVLVYREPDINRIFQSGEDILIPKKCKHQMKAITETAVIMEVSTSHNDNDTYRVESIL